jgi:histidyl-tRNA synthetase
MKTELVKGFKDFIGEEAEKRAEIKKIIVETFEKYGFEPAETPIIEREEFVKGPENQATDEVISDIFQLKDKGKRRLALRYEFTFQLKRIAKNKKLPYKRYQIGPVFRDEPTSSNRFRQFTQCDVDTIGSTIKDEAEILALTKEIFDKLGIKIDILINNRKLLNEVLDDLKIKKNREQVLRELDKLDKQGLKKTQNALKRLGAGRLLEAVSQGEEYLVKFNSYRDIISLKEYCRLYGVDVLFSPTIVRGLSYYTGSVFEIKGKGVRETICAGGSYLVNGKKATGISFGLDRISQLAKIKLQKEKYLVVSLEQDEEAIKVVRILRKKGKKASIFYGKPSKALEFANSYRYGNVIFVGEKEVRAKKFKVKNLKTGKEKFNSFGL